MNQKFGVDTDMVDGVLLIGAYRDGAGAEFEAGAAYVYELDASGSWSETQKLQSKPPVLGAWFGGRVVTTPERLVVTASKEGVSGVADGAAYVFARSDRGWIQTSRLQAPPGVAGSSFGSAASASGATLVIGGSGVIADGVGGGAAFRFGLDESDWLLEETISLADPAAGANSGWAVDLNGGTLLVGSPGSSRASLLRRSRDCDGNSIDDDLQLDLGDGDCNGNLLLDACEIASGSENDCNGNGIPDSCEIADGSATDVDGDGVPDACEGFALSVPGDFTTLQQAIDAIPADSEEVWSIGISAGVFTGPFATGGRSLLISGSAVGQTVLEAPEGETVLDANHGLGFWGWGGKASITLRDLTIRGGSRGAAIGGYWEVLVERCRFEGAVESGLAAAGFWPQSITVLDSHAIECGTGFAIAGMAGPDLVACVAEQCGRGFYLNGNAGGGQPDAIASVLVGCEARDNELAGVWVPSGEYAAVIGGSFSGTTHGRGIEAAWGLQLADAIVANNALGGVSCGGDFVYYDTSVSGCTFENNGGAALLVTDAFSPGQFSGPQISGCSFTGSQFGVRVIAAGLSYGATAIEECVFSGGTAVAVSKPATASGGLAVERCEIVGGVGFDVEVNGPVTVGGADVGNSVTDAAAIGTIECLGFERLRVVGNVFESNESGLAIEWGFGQLDPYLWEYAGCSVAGNLFCGNGEPQLAGTFVDGGNAYLPCCGEKAEDSDGDGSADCIDNCQSIFNPSQADCDADGVGDACEIASGSENDCNGNGIPDSCEIADGSATDVDGDGVPDACEGFALSVPGDFTTLQQAIDAIPADSEEVWSIGISAGVFTGPFATGGRSLLISGSAVGQTVLEAPEGETVLDANHGLGFWGWGGKASITLRDLTIRGGSRGAAIGGYWEVLVERCRFEGAVESGLAAAGFWPQSITVLDSHAIECGTGFAIAGMAGPDLVACVAEQCGRGFYLNGNAGGGQPDAIASVLVGCEARDNELAGVWVPSGEYAAVIGGSFSGTTHGRGIEAAWGLQLADAIVANNALGGVSCGGDFVYYDTSVSGCTFENNGGAALLVTDAFSPGQFSGPQISGCSFTGSQFGVRVIAAGLSYGATAIEECVFSGGTAVAVSKPATASGGLAVERCEIVGGVGFDVEVNGPVTVGGADVGNSVTDAAAIGTIECLGFERLRVVGNVFESNESGLAIEWGFGQLDPYLWEYAGCSVAGNLFCGNGEPQLAGTFVDGGNAYLPCCGEKAEDSDGDGSADCIDNCQSIFNPSQADCDADGVGDACEIASGSENDCNGNGIPYSCEIADGSATDFNANGIPDGCEEQVVISVPSTFATIVEAIAAAADGWVIEVAPGTYSEAIDLGVKGITVASTGGADVTTIDATGSAPTAVVVGPTASGAAAVIRGFTIRGGAGGSPVPTLAGVEGGGGVFLDRATCLIEDCVIVGNEAGFGAGIYAYLGTVELRRVTVESNQAETHGGGIVLYESDAILDAVLVESNSAGGRGGGLYAVRGTQTVRGSEFVANDAGTSGGGVAWFAGDQPLRLEEVLLEANLAASGGDAAWILPNASNLVLDRVVVCGSGPAPFSGQYTVAGEVVIDELCIDCDENGTTDAWEFLLGIAADADSDGVIDACECLGDLDLNGVVNGADLSSLFQAWGEAGGSADLNGDGTVDGADLGILLLSWGICP